MTVLVFVVRVRLVLSDTTCLLLLFLSDVEAVICTLSLHVTVVHVTFLPCMLPSLCCHIGKVRHMCKYTQQ